MPCHAILQCAILTPTINRRHRSSLDPLELTIYIFITHILPHISNLGRQVPSILLQNWVICDTLLDPRTGFKDALLGVKMLVSFGTLVKGGSPD